MIEWKMFDRVMRDCEYLVQRKRLPRFMEKVLRRHSLWCDNAPYCSWSRFTYEMTDNQINDVVSAHRSIKTI